MTLSESKTRIQNRTVLPGNDLDALAAVSVGMNELTPTEDNLRSNDVRAFAIIGDKDEAVPEDDVAILKSTMANLELIVIPGTHAGADGAPYKPRYVQELLRFLGQH